MYDLARDPDCVTNLAARASHHAIKERLKQQLFEELKDQGDPRMLGQGGVFEAYPYADERTRHFHERFTRGEKIQAGWVNETDFEKAPLD